MNAKQNAVMWMGLLLIVVRLVTTSQGKQIWAVLMSGASKGGGTDIIPPLGPLLPEVPLLASSPSNNNTATNSGAGSMMV